MRIALIFSRKCSTYLEGGGFDIENLYEKQALTGSESGLFNTAKGLCELGHEVEVFCKVDRPWLNVEKLAGASIFPEEASSSSYHYLQHLLYHDAFISWNDPDHLPAGPTRGIKICNQQLNDFSISETAYDRRTDAYTFPSLAHAEFMTKHCKLKPEKVHVVPNSTNLEFFDRNVQKEPGSVVYISSPDRGLHHLLDIWPKVRQHTPWATLKIFYRFWPWYEAVKDLDDLIGQRARHIRRRLLELGENGENRGKNGVWLMGPVNNKELAKILCRTQVLAYPCAPIRFTEGFSIAVLDACAAGVVPIISDADALPSIYAGIAEIIPNTRKRENISLWAATIALYLINDKRRAEKSAQVVQFSRNFSRQIVAQKWEDLIFKLNRAKAGA